jgi:septum formation protein
MDIILASGSEFRKKALDVLGIKYTAAPSRIDEESIQAPDATELARKVAEAKALAVGRYNKNSIIIAADLSVVFNGKIYGKPKTEKEAFEMLRLFSGKQLEIVTGLAVHNSKTGRTLSTVEVCKVKFRELSAYEINNYISRYSVLKCAGAFEGDGLLRFADSVNGNFHVCFQFAPFFGFNLS